MKRPRYPIYVPSKGRADTCLTARFLDKDGVDFWIVVEPQDRDAYASRFGGDRLLVLPWNDHKDEDGNPDGLLAVRKWIRKHSEDAGFERHWQLDDNIKRIARRWKKGRRIKCAAGPALAVVEDFVDRYENVAIAGLQYTMFVTSTRPFPPFVLNCHVYSISLIWNKMPYTWRLRYNDDTDICLQVLTGGLCTVLFQAFTADKMRTMELKGGNTDNLYQSDGRLRMARDLERMWPGIVTTGRRFGRPQHYVYDSWKRFDTPLKRRTDIDWTQFEETDDYGLELRKVEDQK